MYLYSSKDFPYSKTTSNWQDTGTGNFTDDKIYVVQTGSKVVARCLQMSTDPGDLVLDPTCGSGTTAYVAEQWRRWITIDTLALRWRLPARGSWGRNILGIFWRIVKLVKRKRPKSPARPPRQAQPTTTSVVGLFTTVSCISR